ncbi:MAG: response regulator transcription factor [Nitriliruptor sp.]|uniref:response regulator transcription factor n=1 Tax=Nitriliruptor sp. TaxID=2448056 RepID=UPI0034A005F3
MSIRVVLVDDHRLFRQSLTLALQAAGIEVVGEAGDGREGIDVTLTTTPDVVLMDVSMPKLDGIAATHELTAAAPATRVVLLTMHDDHEVAEAAREAGAAGYLFKDTAIDEVVEAVEQAASGGTVLGRAAFDVTTWIDHRRAELRGADPRRAEPATAEPRGPEHPGPAGGPDAST